MHHPGHSTLAAAAVYIANNAAGTGLSPRQLVEKVINRRQGWAGSKKGYVWVTFTIPEELPDPPPEHAREIIECEIDYGLSTIWPDGTLDYYQRKENVHKARCSIFFNCVADEIEQMGTEALFSEWAPGDHGMWSICDGAVDMLIRSGFLPGQSILLECDFHAWCSYEGEHDAEFSSGLLYAEPMTVPDSELADIITEDIWPMRFVPRPQSEIRFSSRAPDKGDGW